MNKYSLRISLHQKHIPVKGGNNHDFHRKPKKTDFFLSKPDYFYQYDLILFIQNFDDQSYQFSKLSVILGNTVLTKK